MTMHGGLILPSCPTCIQLLPLSAFLQDTEKMQGRLDDICSDYGSLIGKVKSMYPNETRIFTSHQQGDILLFLAKQGFSTFAWKGKHQNHECPFSSSFPWAFIAEHDVIWYRTSLYSIWVSCPGCVASQPLIHPQPTHCWGSQSGKEKALILC